MPDKIFLQKVRGREFEIYVANILRDLGFQVYENCYVPYKDSELLHAAYEQLKQNRRHPINETLMESIERMQRERAEDEQVPRVHYAQVDLIAVYNNAIFVIECKNFKGQLQCERLESDWVQTVGSYSYTKRSPVSQNYYHAQAVYSQLGIPVYSLVVIPDTTSYYGPGLRTQVFHTMDLTLLPALYHTPQEQTATAQAIHAKMLQWANPSDEVRATHMAYVNSRVNAVKGITRDMQNNVCQELYCVCLPDGNYYAGMDSDGFAAFTPKSSDAAFYKELWDAADVAALFPNAEVCTLELGALELLSDVPDELDDMTPEEYAYAVGARPW